MVTWRPTIQKDKYQQVILFLLNSAANNTFLGKVKLFKLLYYIDFDHYQYFKTPVTGDIYYKRAYGPVGKNAELILHEMASAKLISINTKPVGDVQQYVYTAPHKFKAHDKFLASEMEVLEQVAKKWANHRTGEIVTATHGEAPWRAVDMSAEIPYSLAFYREPMLVDAESHGDEELVEAAAD